MSLFVDSKGRLLIGTNDSGLAVLENNEFTFYNHREGLRNSSVRSMVEDDHGNVLMATMVGVAYLDSNDKVHMLDDARTVLPRKVISSRSQISRSQAIMMLMN